MDGGPIVGLGLVGEACKRAGGDKRRWTQDRPRHTWRTERFYVGVRRVQRAGVSGGFGRNGCPRPERRRYLRLRHRTYVSSVSLAKGPHESSPDARRK